MGIYTNFYSDHRSDYNKVEPFVGESFNYQELGILAATEIEMNHNTFMKSIALKELAAFEQTGSTDVLYESVKDSKIVKSIVAFFKNIIEKISKIFKTFVMKMESWFGDNKKFANKYEKEFNTKLNKLPTDFKFNGYKYTHTVNTTLNKNDALLVSLKDKSDINNILSSSDLTFAKNIDEDTIKTYKENISNCRDELENYKNRMRKITVDTIANNSVIPVEFADIDSKEDGYDNKDFNKELFKVFRNGKEKKEELAIDYLKQSDTSIISKFNDTKKSVKELEAKLITAITNKIKTIKESRDNNIEDKDAKEKNEVIVSMATLYQALYSGVLVTSIQACSALLQAQKEELSQLKEFMIKVINYSEKPAKKNDQNTTTNESYNYSTDLNFDFIENVKLI